MWARDMRTLIHAAGGGLDDVERVIASLGAERVAELVVAELRPHVRLDDVPDVDGDLVVRVVLGPVEYALLVKPGVSGWSPASVRESIPGAAATVRQDLAELALGVFGPTGAASAATRSVSWRDADDFASFHSPSPVFPVVRRLLAAMDRHPDADLTALAEAHGSDKWGLHNYTPHYQRHFAPLRDRPLTVLEIGVGGYRDPAGGGASLRMWRDFFPRALVYGVDIVDKSLLDEGRIRTLCADQADPGSLARVVAQTGPLDIVIDDGSHISKHVIGTFDALFPHVRPGGLYVIEDLQTSYWPSFGGSEEALPGTTTSMGMLKDLADGLNYRELTGRNPRRPRSTDALISGVHFYHNLAVLEKGGNAEPGAPSWLVRTMTGA